MHPPPRHLVQFHPKHVQHAFTDVLVLGAGIAGLRAALAVPSSQRVMVISKERVEVSTSAWAQGGLAGVLSPEDSIQDHVTDTLIAGDRLCDETVVRMVVEEAPQQISDLIRMGVQFDHTDGQIALTTEGGHSHARIVHALGDATGHEVMRGMIARARQAPNIEIWERTFTVDLLTHEGRCVGVLVARPHRERLIVWAKTTILASGGAARIYRESTNSPVATGDGMAAAFRAGAVLQDMEFMQFHPTLLYVAGSSRSLISEALRGEGAYLRDKDGTRFMLQEDPRAEKATRDIVARAIMRTIDRTRHPCVYLDLSHLPSERVRLRFPGIGRACSEFGLNIASDLIPVRPGAHYTIGGVRTDRTGRTSIPGLYAAGEVSSTGLHGANRLASNSLIEGLVFGMLCGEAAGREAADRPDRYEVPPLVDEARRETGPALDIPDILNSLRSLMGRAAGIERDGPGLAEAADQVRFWCGYVLRREFSQRSGWELSNLLTIGSLIIGSALVRQESRGTHYRRDFPKRDDNAWRRRVICLSHGEIQADQQGLPALSHLGSFP